MAKMQSAERVSANDLSDNFVYQRSVLAYKRAAERVSGEVLEIGTGMGYGIEVVAPAAASYTTIDKSVPQLVELPANVTFRQMQVPPIGFEDESFDLIVDFMILHHVEGWRRFLDEAFRVLWPGGEMYINDLTRKGVHLTDALFHWEHAEEPLFTMKEFE
ncbi:MAG: class I SAM-dependent methyltransferase, partial [Alistipes sp.]|nr:class I SAM-dependent methyltransferase [Alistipes sp.]